MNIPNNTSAMRSDYAVPPLETRLTYLAISAKHMTEVAREAEQTLEGTSCECAFDRTLSSPFGNERSQVLEQIEAVRNSCASLIALIERTKHGHNHQNGMLNETRRTQNPDQAN